MSCGQGLEPTSALIRPRGSLPGPLPVVSTLPKFHSMPRRSRAGRGLGRTSTTELSIPTAHQDGEKMSLVSRSKASRRQRGEVTPLFRVELPRFYQNPNLFTKSLAYVRRRQSVIQACGLFAACLLLGGRKPPFRYGPSIALNPGTRVCVSTCN